MNFNNICILGMGYVGLTLAVIMSEKKFKVTGVEINPEICKRLNEGEPNFHENRLGDLLRKHLNNNLKIYQNIPDIPHDVFVICVTTPVSKEDKTPNLDYVIKATEDVGIHLSDGNLVIIRSTIPVGATRNIIKPILDKTGKEYSLAFCPERTAEGNAIKELVELPQIIGGVDDASVEKSSSIFRRVVPTILGVSSLESAEMVKLINNSYRDLNFAFANEVALICEDLKLDAIEIIKSANYSYPRSNVPVPGFVGGACLEKDPYILLQSINNKKINTDLILSSRKINEYLPEHVVIKIQKKFEEAGKNLKDSKIFIMGFGFKGRPETDDMRGSLTLELVDKLRELGCSRIYGHDFIVEDSDLKKKNVIPLSVEEGFKDADCVIFANNHEKYFTLDIEKLILSLNKPAIFIDVWYIFNPSEIKRDGLIYGGVGVD